MIKVIFMAAIVGSMNFPSAIAQEQYRKIYLEPCKENQQTWLPLYDNFKTYFCVDSSRIWDSKTYSKIEKDFSDYLPKKDPQRECGRWVISFRYWIISIPNLTFMSISSGNCIDSHPYDIAYDTDKDTLFILNYMAREQIDKLIPPSQYELSQETQILDYCRLYVLLDNPVANIRFISSIEELLMDAVYSEPHFYSLDTVKQYENVNLGLPAINGLTQDTLWGSPSLLANDTAEVSFYMAKNDDLVKVYMILTKNDIIKYDENIFSKTLDWRGFRSR
jgi:hypothetical protein